ncbi:MAG: tetratricopeptide repeat protein [Deltaproteobacteria bacterium]|nr:tetratricopeptide repeat protein [Deltaproteobacteria bacterium]
MSKKINISSKEKNLIVYVVLTIVTLAVFWQVNQFDFVNIDDGVYVTENSHLQSGLTLDGLRWAFTTTYAEFWHPLTWLSLMLDYQLFGLNAGGYHMTNLILHILSTLLLFWLFNRMTGALWPSAFVAAFFALHPLHVESVAWVAERKDVLSAFFWMLTLCLYVYYAEKPDVKRYLVVLFSFICGLMSKSMVVTLPVIMILLDYWPLKRFESKKGDLILWQLKEKIPFFALSAVFSLITFYAHFKPLVKYYPLYYRMVNAPVSFVTYLEKTFWPHHLAFYYPFSVQLSMGQVFGSALLIIFISVFVIMMIKRLPCLFVGWLWYAVTIIPVIGIIKVGLFAMADRYTYLSSIGIAVMMAWGIPPLFKNEKIRKIILITAGTAFLAIMAILTWQQCSYWGNSIKLSQHALRVTKNNHLAHGVLAYKLFSEGKIEEAMNHFSEAIRIKPDYDDGLKNRGLYYFKLGNYARAIEDLNEAIRLRPDCAPYYYYRGSIYDNLGQYQKAVNDYSETIRLKSDSVHAHNNRGGVYFKLGQYQNALKDYNEAIRLQQDYAEAYNNRAFVYLNQGQKELGCHDAQKACLLGNCRISEGAKVRGLCR